jgi:uncharacterized membrane protein YdjX (TVP38/TMEM64 family)
MPRPSSSPRRLPSTRSAFLRLGGLVLILVVTSAIGYRLGWFDYRHTLEHVQRIRRSYSFWTFTIGFVLVFGLGTSVGVPAFPVTVAAGALFGVLLGSILSWIGGMLGAVGGYIIARTIGHGVVLRWTRRFPKVAAAVEESRDFASLLRLRLIPVIPLGMANFVGGLAKAPFGSYLAATALGIIPSIIIYAYFADSLLERVGNGRENAWFSLIISSLLLILLSLTPKFFRRKPAPVTASRSDRDDSPHSPQSRAAAASSPP